MALAFGIMGLIQTNKAIKKIENIMKSEIFVEIDNDEPDYDQKDNLKKSFLQNRFSGMNMKFLVEQIFL